ncbi:hypothetical protein D9M72_425800 [compost metagenome]
MELSVNVRTFSQRRIRYSKSRLISTLVRFAPAVRRMTPMPCGTSRPRAISFRRLRSCRLVILREMPPPRAVFGIRTE